MFFVVLCTTYYMDLCMVHVFCTQMDRPKTLDRPNRQKLVPCHAFVMHCADGSATLHAQTKQRTVVPECSMRTLVSGGVEDSTGYPHSISNALKFYDTRAHNAIIAKV